MVEGMPVLPFAFLGFIALLGAIPVYMIVDGDGPSAATPESISPDLSEDESPRETTALLRGDTAVADDYDDLLDQPSKQQTLDKPRNYGTSSGA